MSALTLPKPALPRWTRRWRQPVGTSAHAAFRTGLTWLLASLLLTVFSLLGQVPLWTLAVFAGCTVWRYLLEITGRPLPSMATRLALFLPVAWAILSTYGSRPNATGLLTFLVALLSLKILELRSPRDFTIVALLGYFMTLSVLFYNQSLVLCLYLAVTLLLNSVALACAHGKLHASWPALRLALGMSAQALPLVALLFIAFPRVQAGFLHRFGYGQVGTTGMSDTLQPGSFSGLVQSTDPVFRARLKSVHQLTQDQLYWRGLVLERCDHPLSWRALYQPAQELPTARGEVEQTITIIPNGQRWLFALDRPVGVHAPDNLKAESTTAETLRSRDTIYHTSVYTAFSSFAATSSAPTLEPRRKKFLTQIPTDFNANPRAVLLVASWKRQAHGDEDVIRLANTFFRSSGFSYTLSPGLLKQQTALDQFLFESRKGFCEHYAGAYCTLMRAAGVPARIVVGYQGGEFNQYGGHFTVRQSDAHAWAEVWLDARGWTREDPTAFVAPDRVSYGAENYAFGGALTDAMRLERLNGLNTPGSLRWLLRNTSQLWDNLDQQWNMLVLGYDQDTQLTVLERLGLDKLDWVGGTTLTLAIAFTILAIGGGLVYLLDRRPASRRDPVAWDYARFCRKLSVGAELDRAPGEGPLDFARRAQERLPAQSEGIRHITDLYVASRYARDGGAGVAGQFHDAVARFRVISPAPEEVAATEGR